VYGVNEDIELIDALRRLAAALPREASPETRDRLTAAVRARQPRRPPGWIYLAAAAACLALVFALTLGRKQPVTADRVYLAPGFIALPYSQSGVPLENAVVIRVQMRPSELTSMGVAVPAAASTARFNADILVGQDGVARAVRLVD
jgi:hypothetical protein